MDLEKQAQHDVESGSNELDSSNGSHGSAPPPNAAQVIDPNDPGERTVANIRQSNGVLRRLRDVETWMDRKMKVEGMGVERIPENKRKPPQILNVSTCFLSRSRFRI